MRFGRCRPDVRFLNASVVAPGPPLWLRCPERRPNLQDGQSPIRSNHVTGAVLASARYGWAALVRVRSNPPRKPEIIEHFQSLQVDIGIDSMGERSGPA